MEKIKVNWIIIVILLIGGFLRLYNIAGYMTFLGDEGRDAIIVRNLLVKADPILIGPGTSVGNMYLGPLYYYFMTPFLFLSNFNPVGPAIGVALLGVATIFLVFIAGRDWFNNKVGLISAGLYAIAPTAIIYSRSSWNPNIMPFFALLSIYSVWKVYTQKKYNWLLVTAISFAFVLQSHYLGVLLFPVLFLYWFLARVPVRYQRSWPSFAYTLFAVFLFLFLMSPLLIFDIRHNFLNSNAFYKFITVREETVSINIFSTISKIYPIFEQINTSLLTAKNIFLGKIATIVLVAFLIFRKKSILLFWLVSGIVGLALYKGNIYDHYFGFLFPAPFLLMGIFLTKVYESKYRILSILIFIILIFVNLINNPFKYNPNNQMQRATNVAKKLIEESKNEKFNFAVVAQNNYEDGYQYFLEKEEANFVEIDAQIKDSVTNQLFVICEMPLPAQAGKEKCDPTHSAKAEVANFGWSKIENQWEVDGVIIYRLIHSK